jgi:hypothetical protein
LVSQQWLDNCRAEVRIAPPIEGLALIRTALEMTNFSYGFLFGLVLWLYNERTILLVDLVTTWRIIFIGMGAI